MTIFSPKQFTRRRNYRAERMSRIRCQISGWLQEYEHANTKRHREVCMQMIQRHLRQYEWYGNRFSIGGNFDHSK